MRTGLTTDEAYAAAVRDVKLFLEGRHRDLANELDRRMEMASEDMRFEEAGRPAQSGDYRSRNGTEAEDGGGGR